MILPLAGFVLKALIDENILSRRTLNEVLERSQFVVPSNAMSSCINSGTFPQPYASLKEESETDYMNVMK